MQPFNSNKAGHDYDDGATQRKKIGKIAQPKKPFRKITHFILSSCDKAVIHNIYDIIFAFIICNSRITNFNCDTRVTDVVYDSTKKLILKQFFLPLTLYPEKPQFTQFK